MPTLPLSLGMASGVEPSLPVSTQELVNLYTHVNPEDAKNKTSLYACPGLDAYATVGVGPIRMLAAYKEGFVVVSKNACYFIGADTNPVFLGSITGNGFISHTTTRDGIVFTCNGNAYMASDIALVNIPVTQVGTATFLDGYTVFNQRNTQIFFVSQVNDPLTYDGTEFTLASAYPDNIVAIKAVNRELWVLKEHSYEVFSNTGALDFPFQRINSAIIERGCFCPSSVVSSKGVLVFVGDDRKIYSNNGFSIQKISTHAIDYVLERDSSLGSCTASMHSTRGHFMFTLRTPQNTLVYDFSTQLWHRRKSKNSDTWRVGYIMDTGNDVYCGDYASNKILKMSTTTYTEDGNEMVKETITPPFFLNGKRGTMFDLRVFFESGTGLSTGQGAAPKAMLQHSDDGGYTWSSEQWAEIGAIGRYGYAVRWARLGQFSQRALRIHISDPIKTVITGGTVEVESE